MAASWILQIELSKLFFNAGFSGVAVTITITINDETNTST
jgi:hypothetical protein